MGHTRDTHLFWTLVFLMVALLTPIAYSVSSPFLELPIYVSALAGGPVNLTWLTAFNDINIAWCYWDYADCLSDPDTVSIVTECPPDEFVGYVYETKARQNISSRHKGWTFLNKSSPCKGGLHRNILEHKHDGWYRMNIYTLANVSDEDSKPNKRSSKYSAFHVYNENDLKLWLQMGNMSASKILLRQAKNGIIELESQTLKNKSVTINIWNVFPPETVVTVKRHNFGMDQVTLNMKCAWNLDKSCNVDITEEGRDVVYVIELDTGIQGYPMINIKQRCHFTTHGSEDDVDTLSDSSTSETYPWWALAFLLVIIGLFVVGTILVAVLRDRVCPKTEYQAPNNVDDDAESPMNPSCSKRKNKSMPLTSNGTHAERGPVSAHVDGDNTCAPANDTEEST